MAARAVWRGFLKVAELTCAVGLHTAISTAERVSFHTLNRATGNRVSRQFVDRETGKPVPSEAQVKGYEIGQDDYVVLEPDEIAAAVPGGDKTLAVETFVPCASVDQVFFDRPYYVAPSDPVAAKAFAVVREGLRAKDVAALARTVLFRRVRTVLIRAHGAGMIATILNYDYEVRSARDAFNDIPDITVKGEMLKLAEHIIETKKGTFDPARFGDRYEAALAELVRAKLEGRPIERPRRKATAEVIDLMAALRKSAAQPSAGGHAAKAVKPKAAPKRRLQGSAAAGRSRKAG